MDRNKSLMSRLLDAGFHTDELGHHYSDLYIPATPLADAVINEWLKDNGWKRELFVTEFSDRVTGNRMYDVPFQYDPFWVFLRREDKPCAGKKESSAGEKSQVPDIL